MTSWPTRCEEVLAVRSAGFSLIEVLIATAIVMGGVGALAQLFLASGNANRGAEAMAIAVLLAEQKVEELRAADAGLALSPSGTLAADTDGFVDYFDAAGGSLGGSQTTPPGGTIFVRRWSVAPRTGGAVETLILQVVVMPLNRSTAVRGSARLVSVRMH